MSFDFVRQDNTNLQRTLIEQCRHVSNLSKELNGEITALNNDVVKVRKNVFFHQWPKFRCSISDDYLLRILRKYCRFCEIL